MANIRGGIGSNQYRKPKRPAETSRPSVAPDQNLLSQTLPSPSPSNEFARALQLLDRSVDEDTLRRVWEVIGSSPTCDPEQLRQLAKKLLLDAETPGERRIRALDVLVPIINNLSTPPDVFVAVTTSQARHSRGVALSMVYNPACPPEALIWLSRHKDSQVRLDTSQHTQCPPEALTYLAGPQESAATRARVARHPNTPPEVLRALLSDPAKSVSVAAAENPNLPPASRAMWQLVHDQTS
jgi:hypothetical protein